MERTWVGEATEIIVRSALAHALWQKGEHRQAWGMTRQLLDKLAKSSIVDYSIHLSYSHLMQLVLDALEQSYDGRNGEIERHEIERYAGTLIGILKKYCAIFEIGEPAYAHLRACLAWYHGRRETAYKLWRAAAEQANSLGMILEEGQAHMALGSHLPLHHPEREDRIERAREVFKTGGFQNYAAFANETIERSL